MGSHNFWNVAGSAGRITCDGKTVMTYLRWFGLSLLLFGLIAIAVLMIGSSTQQVHSEATLSDGTVVRFEKAAVGTVTYDSYPRLKALLVEYVTSRYQGQFGERFKGSFGIQPNSIGLLFSLWKPDGKRIRESSRFLSRIEFIESTGHVFSTEVNGYSSSSSVVLFNADAFPRRDPLLHLKCYEVETDRLLFDLTIPNPGYRPPYQEWTSEPLPAVRTAAPLTVTLKHGLLEFAHPYVRDDDLEIHSSDPTWTKLPLQRRVWFTDATGNLSYNFKSLSPYEPAWKINVHLGRNVEAEFAPDEVWRTERFRLPSPLTAERVNKSRIVSGVEVTLNVLSSAGALQDDGRSVTVTETSEVQGPGTSISCSIGPAGAVTTIMSGLPFFHVLVSQVDQGTNLIINVRDQTGAKISLQDNRTYSMNGQTMYFIQFEPTPETKEVELEFIVNSFRSFEFLVAPPKEVTGKD